MRRLLCVKYASRLVPGRRADVPLRAQAQDRERRGRPAGRPVDLGRACRHRPDQGEVRQGVSLQVCAVVVAVSLPSSSSSSPRSSALGPLPLCTFPRALSSLSWILEQSAATLSCSKQCTARRRERETDLRSSRRQVGPRAVRASFDCLSSSSPRSFDEQSSSAHSLRQPAPSRAASPPVQPQARPSTSPSPFDSRRNLALAHNPCRGLDGSLDSTQKIIRGHRRRAE